MTEQPLNKTQKMFLLSFLSELGAGVVGPGLGPMLNYVINQELARLESHLGRWEIVWGPAVFQTNEYGLADNVMYVAGSPGFADLVVAIAGTNPNSLFDWFQLDWNIRRAVPWRSGNAPPDAVVSLGCATGLRILLDMRPAATLPGAGSKLMEFLNRVASAGPPGEKSITVVGHSLGGTLSLPLAVLLIDSQRWWDNLGRMRVDAYSFAGPTPGNESFSGYATERLGDNGHRLANSLDVSTMGWNVEDLERAKSVYAAVIPISPQVTEVLSFRQRQARHVGYVHVLPAAPPLSGRINTSILDAFKSSYENYHLQADYQHNDAYFELLNIPQFINYQWIIRAALRPLAIGVAFQRYAIYKFQRAMDELVVGDVLNI